MEEEDDVPLLFFLKISYLVYRKNSVNRNQSEKLDGNTVEGVNL